ncbi:MAG: 50S ribosomal protein L31 [Actinobacteria bacterium]|nr:MAG: 50S ribosomal protein L31 [Actinomycetota bacterium]
MKSDIHPKYGETKVICSCGESFTTRSTKPEIKIEICSKCHPFYTGKQKFVDSGGRVERFQKKFSKLIEQKKAEESAAASAAAKAMSDKKAKADKEAAEAESNPDSDNAEGISDEEASLDKEPKKEGQVEQKEENT